MADCRFPKMLESPEMFVCALSLPVTKATDGR